MVMNLRLAPEAQAALRAEAERSGRSQEEIVREAIDRLLARETERAGELASLSASGRVRPPRRSYRRVTSWLVPEPGSSTLDLLERDDRA